MNKKNKKFWKWTNQADGASERVLELYGTIAEESWFQDDVTPKMFHDELFSGSGPVTIWLSSPGGDVIAASQIYSYLMDYPSDVTVKIDGIAASAASVIAMAGTTVLMAPTSLMMIHQPMAGVFGNHDDMEKAMSMLDEVQESIINAYQIKTNLTRAKLAHMMNQETWMNANKAIELGFADGLLEDSKKDAKDAPAIAFSGKAAEISLLNKLEVINHDDEKGNAEEEKRDEPVAETPAEPTPAAEDAAKEEQEPVAEPTAPVGTPVSDLEKRLNLLKM